MQFLRGLGSHGIQFPHIPVPHEGHEILRCGDLEIPVGLFLLAGGLGGGLGIGHPHAAGQMHLIPGALLDEMPDAPGSFQILCLLRHVQIRLVQSDVLGGGGIGVPDLMELMGDGLVFIEVGMHEDAVGALPVGILDVHAGADAVFPRLVAAGGHHAPFRGKGADDQRLAPEGRVVPHFHRRVERVHIHMDDDPVHLPTSPFFLVPLYPIIPPANNRGGRKREGDACFGTHLLRYGVGNYLRPCAGKGAPREKSGIPVADLFPEPLAPGVHSLSGLGGDGEDLQNRRKSQ